MKAASGLITGQRPVAELAHDAVKLALGKAGLDRADHVILFLSRDFARNPQTAIIAAARAAGCLSVCGSTANGLMTECGWQLDQSAAAVLVIGALEAPAAPEGPRLSFSSHGRLPFDWQTDVPRAGFLDSDGATWMHGRIAPNDCAELQLPGTRSQLSLSSGLRPLCEAQHVDLCRGYELIRIGGHRAVDSLLRVLPPELRQNPPLHQITLLRHADEPAIAILSVNADGSLTLADNLENDTALTWAIRHPLAAEQQTRESLTALAQQHPQPAFALMFSCIGRGPLFFDNDDRDLLLFRETFPDTPLLGAYGTSQISPGAGKNLLFHNTALTLLFERIHV